MKKILVKILVFFLILLQFLNLSWVFAESYGKITSSTTVTEDSTAEYVFFTGDSQKLEISGVNLTVTGYVDNYT
jgi:hypothetical protein